jgi:transcriptional regulator with XRE-family HTH domain
MTDPKGQVTLLTTHDRRPVLRGRLSPDVAAALRAARHRLLRASSPEYVARRVGISVNHLYKLERGERAPSLVVARALIVVLDLPLDVAQALVDEARADAGLSRS